MDSQVTDKIRSMDIDIFDHIDIDSYLENRSRKEKYEFLKLLKERNKRRVQNKLRYYTPYEKQIEFHSLGAKYTQRCFMAGNQLGKTLAGAMEAAYHATGLYPDWWEGKRFKESNKGWACGETSEVVRNSIQLLLVGDISKEGVEEGLGSGSIPKDKIIRVTKAIGIKDLIDIIYVRHKTGGTSTIALKSYVQGRKKFQAATLDWIWFDEEPPKEIYSEGLTRTNKSGQHSFMTYTPLLGMSEVTHEFYEEPSENQIVINMTIDDVDHYTDKEKKIIVDSYPEYERDARAKGIPTLGSGRVFTIAEEKISEDSILEIPKHWYLLNGLDFGWTDPQACVKIAWDKDNDIIHVTNAFKESECDPIMARSTIKLWGPDITCAWPADGYQHDKSGKETAALYRDAGFNMLYEHATHEVGGNGVEAGILEMHQRMKTGRLKVDKYLAQWFEEFRMYHRKDGIIVKTRDHLMDATRYGIMMKRFAELISVKTKSSVRSLINKNRRRKGILRR